MFLIMDEIIRGGEAASFLQMKPLVHINNQCHKPLTTMEPLLVNWFKSSIVHMLY